MADAIEVVNNEPAHRFEAELEGETAFAEYNLVEHGIILPHTVVPEAFEGRGVGGQLAKAALKYARDRGLKVIPLCPFIAGYIGKHPEHHDLVHETYRGRLGI
jgi:predicted GNAT family acetyltransferase